MAIYFRLLTEDAYVQVGNYQISETYNASGDNFLYYNAAAENNVALPTNFNREWAVISNANYDWGAYGTGLKRSVVDPITLPDVSRRTLLYMFDLRGTAERRTLVETEKTAAQLVAQGIIASDGIVAFNTFEEYVEKFIQAGRFDFGGMGTPVLPDGITVSQVSELYSYNATIDGVNLDASDAAQPVQVYVSPTWINNERPMFDMVYFLDDNLRYANGTYAVNQFQEKPLRRVRWLGGVPSENIAAINRVGTHLDYSATKYTQVASVSDVAFTENGVTYLNADSYNLVNLKRF